MTTLRLRGTFTVLLSFVLAFVYALVCQKESKKVAIKNRNKKGTDLTISFRY
jgi:hypothetical protein